MSEEVLREEGMRKEERKGEGVMLFSGVDGLHCVVRVSVRAKSARLKMTPHGGLVVVVPVGFNKKHIPALLVRHEGWIKKTVERFDGHRLQAGALTENGLPCSVVFPFFDEEWAVVYNNKGSGGRRVVEVDDGVGKQLLLPGDGADTERCRRHLLAWLKRRAERNLIPNFEKLAAANGFRYTEVLVRLQRSRWGSCTGRGVITLNTKLLFLPEYLIRAIMIHELCHTVQMNHSKAFWDLVCRHDPLWRSHTVEMRSAWKYVPEWVGA
ncbi:MAG: SprT family zinc-dependent metalloprotease [Chlorobiales bacterium]|nr:SprT family zinc-dependent metalloprotease [Chlorobiales bacterium]